MGVKPAPCGDMAVERPALVADAATMVIFGATGDLAKRKLLPALYNLNGARLLPEGFAVVGVGREAMTTEAYRRKVSRDLQEFGTVTTERLKCEWLESRLVYLTSDDFGDPAAYERPRETLAAATEIGGGRPPNSLFYLATPPSLFGPIVERLHAAGLLAEDGGWRRVVIEKPFGHDLDSARALTRQLARLLEERQIDYADYFGAAPNTGYETLLHDVMTGDPTLFHRADIVEAGWSVVDPVLHRWAETGDGLRSYRSGSWGPPEADALLARDGREWRRPDADDSRAAP